MGTRMKRSTGYVRQSIGMANDGKTNLNGRHIAGGATDGTREARNKEES